MAKKSVDVREYLVFVGLLRDLRNRVDLTQGALASRLGVNQTFVSDVELGKRRLDVLQMMAWCKATTGQTLTSFIEEFEGRFREPGRWIEEFEGRFRDPESSPEKPVVRRRQSIRSRVREG